MALRRTGAVERAAHREILALVIEQSDLVAVEEEPALLVEDEGVVGPAVPQILDDIDELAGALVAVIMLDMLVAAEILARPPALELVTTFQPARPLLSQSSAAKRRATLKGWS